VIVEERTKWLWKRDQSDCGRENKVVVEERTKWLPYQESNHNSAICSP
jgi:hypothetical protein